MSEENYNIYFPEFDEVLEDVILVDNNYGKNFLKLLALRLYLLFDKNDDYIDIAYELDSNGFKENIIDAIPIFSIKRGEYQSNTIAVNFKTKKDSHHLNSSKFFDMELEFFGGSSIDIELFKTILSDSLIKESIPEYSKFTMELLYNKIDKDVFEKEHLSYLYSIVYEIIVTFIKLGDFYNFDFIFVLSDGIYIEDYGITFETLKEKNEYFYIIDEKQKKNFKIKKGFE